MKALLTSIVVAVIIGAIVLTFYSAAAFALAAIRLLGVVS